MEETISLKELFDTLKKRLVLILTITMIAVITAATVSYFVLTPQYQASTQVLVSQEATGASILSSGNPFGSDERYISTYNVILQSPYILEQVMDELDLDGSYRSLNAGLSVQREGESQVVTITIEDNDPSMAVAKANATAEVFREEVVDLLNVDNIHVLSPADLSDSMNPVSPNPELNIAIGLVVGLMGSVGLAFLLEFLDNTLRTEENIEKSLGLPVLGSITIMDQEVERVDDRMRPSEKEGEKNGIS